MIISVVDFHQADFDSGYIHQSLQEILAYKVEFTDLHVTSFLPSFGVVAGRSVSTDVGSYSLGQGYV
ncbi:MAG: hypothetical protein U5L96_14665 [Owenweeksia sp.]|nr:hypothetical protein [Owenweeksia sp.]